MLDNFGSGLASLSYLFSYPFDYIKIDHRFIKSLPRSLRNLKLIQSVMLISGQRGLFPGLFAQDPVAHSHRRLRNKGGRHLRPRLGRKAAKTSFDAKIRGTGSRHEVRRPEDQGVLPPPSP